MLLTAQRIPVTLEMLSKSNMTRGNQIGIPKNPKTGEGSLIWKQLPELTDEDYDTLEEYFIHLPTRTNK